MLSRPDYTGPLPHELSLSFQLPSLWVCLTTAKGKEVLMKVIDITEIRSDNTFLVTLKGQAGTTITLQGHNNRSEYTIAR